MAIIIKKADDIEGLKLALLSSPGIPAAAKKLGISISTLSIRIREYDLQQFRDHHKATYIGKRFHRLIILHVSSGSKRIHRTATCLCDCGQTITTSLGRITNGTAKSCGCLKSDSCIARSTIHGHSGSTEYNSWCAMKARCLNPAAHNYKYYGGRGVNICDRWTESFGAFYEDIGPKPSPSHTVDRINPFGDYEPSNCRWATKSEQSNNQRRHHAPMG